MGITLGYDTSNPGGSLYVCEVRRERKRGRKGEEERVKIMRCVYFPQNNIEKHLSWAPDNTLSCTSIFYLIIIIVTLSHSLDNTN